MEAFYLVNSEIFGLSNSTAVVYNFLCRVNNVSTGTSYYKRRNIARACNISESTVVRAIRALCKKGLLEIRRRFDHGRQTSNNYILIDNPQMKMNAGNASRDSNPASEQSTDQTQPAQPRLFTCRLPADAQGLSANELKVYSYLSYRADMDGICKPAKKEIAADCGVSLSTVSRAIKTLNAARLIEIRSQTRLDLFGNNGTSVNLYILKGAEVPDTPQSGSAESEKADLCPDVKCDVLSAEQPSAPAEGEPEHHKGDSLPIMDEEKDGQPNPATPAFQCSTQPPFHTSVFLRLFDTLPHITRATPRTMPRIKETVNSRENKRLSTLAGWYRRTFGPKECRNE